jgi:hypothetical protein
MKERETLLGLHNNLINRSCLSRILFLDDANVLRMAGGMCAHSKKFNVFCVI